MSSQKVGSIKIPPLDKEIYSLWKKKMTSVHTKAANPLYMGIMDNGPFVPQKLIPESDDWKPEKEFLKSLYQKESFRIQRHGKKTKWL